MEPTPKFVLDYIQFLKKFYKTYPVETAARFNFPAGEIPRFRLEPYFQSDRGWAVLHLEESTGRSLLTEFIDPPIAQDSALPPLQFDPGVPIVVPKYAPPEGYFVLIVENEGLPAGYAATTTVQIRTLSNSLAVTGGGAGFNVPFRGQYELPVLGTSPLILGDAQQLRYDFSATSRVNTLVGEYEAVGPFYSIFPKSGELHRTKIKWVKSDPFIPPPPPAEPPKPPTQLPPEPTPKPTLPIPTQPVPPIRGTSQVGIVQVQTQPIFYPSTTPRRPLPLPPAPSSVKLTKPFKDPDNSYRATSVQQMFSFTPEPNSRAIIYSIGVRPDTIRPTTYRIRNNTLNTQLRFTFKVPEFLFLDVPNIMIMNPQQETLVTVSFNENNAREKSLTRTRFYSDTFEWDVEPIEVRGPVYIARSLPPVVYSQPGEIVPPQAPRVQAAAPLIGQIGGSTGFDVDFYRNLYIALDTPRVTMIKGERRGIKIDAWIGDETVGPSTPGSIPLQFEPNSIMWEVLNPAIMDIEALNGSNNATLVAIAPGISEFKAKIMKPPVNVAKGKWDIIYNSSIEIRGGGRRVLLPNAVSGIEIVGVNNIYTSTSQTSQR
jgi:hypothetical protein